jgi:hypothetical protein
MAASTYNIINNSAKRIVKHTVDTKLQTSEHLILEELAAKVIELRAELREVERKIDDIVMRVLNS